MNDFNEYFIFYYKNTYIQHKYELAHCLKVIESH